MRKVLLLAVVMVLVFGLTSGVAAEVRSEPNWDVTGSWLLDFADGTANRKFVDIVQDKEGNVSGSFVWLNNGDWEYGGTLEGYVSGNDLYLYYDRGETKNYTGEFNGTITKYGMSGTFDAGNGFRCNWSAQGEPTLLYEARVAGGGQLLSSTGQQEKNGKGINYKISFGGGAYIVNGDYWLDGLEVTFHNVSKEGVRGGKFIATSITNMNFNFADGVANYTVSGTFNGEEGYLMIVRVQDSGEPGGNDNLRFELYDGSSKTYDSFSSGDFPGESFLDGNARNFLNRGNIQVEDLR